MTAIYVQPDKEWFERWVALGFTSDWDATPTAIGHQAMETLKTYVPIGCRLNGWVVDESEKPTLRKAPVQGDREEMLAVHTGGRYANPGPDYRLLGQGKIDWLVLIKVRMPKVLTPKYQEPLGPDEGFERREDLPPELQRELGSESKVTVNA